MKPTPGPWHAAYYNPCGWCVLPETGADERTPAAIAVCYGPDAEANARFIAAAQRLLAATVEDDIRYGAPLTELEIEAMEEAKAVIVDIMEANHGYNHHRKQGGKSGD